MILSKLVYSFESISMNCKDRSLHRFQKAQANVYGLLCSYATLFTSKGGFLWNLDDYLRRYTFFWSLKKRSTLDNKENEKQWRIEYNFKIVLMLSQGCSLYVHNISSMYNIMYQPPRIYYYYYYYSCDIMKYKGVDTPPLLEIISYSFEMK